MLTAADFNSITFRKSMSGYNFGEVDSFLEEAAKSFEQLSKENAELLEKLDVLIAQVEKYRSDEDLLKNAILNSQRTGDAIVKSAQERADIIIADAHRRIEKTEGDISAQAKAKKAELEHLEQKVSGFKNQLLDLFNKQIGSINEFPFFEAAAPEVFEDPAEPDDADRTIVFDKADAEPEKQEEPVVFPSKEEAEEEPAPIEDATREFKVTIPEEEEKVDVTKAIENFDTKKEIFFGADYDMNEDDKKRGLFGRKK